MMPILDDPSERPGCVPTSKDEPFLPSIKPSLTSSKPANNNNAINAATTAVAETTHPSTNPTTSSRDRHDSRFRKASNASLHHHQDAYNASLKSYSSAPASESSTPFKLPTIDRSKSNSVSSLASERYGGGSHHHKSRGRSRDRRSRLCRSPSCPTALWNNNGNSNEPLETPDTCRLEEDDGDDASSKAYVRPFLTHREDGDVKLPSIFQSRVNGSVNLNMSSSTAHSSNHNSRDTSPFSFRREATFLNLSTGSSSHPNHHHHHHHHHSLSHDGSATRVSPPLSTEDLDKTMSRSSTQSSALLLPIQSGQDVRNAIKSKRKRKKQNGLLASAEMGSDAEKLLREKLGAIERRGDRDSSSSAAHEGEKTTLSDTTFIDKVKDENCSGGGGGGSSSIAKGASEAMASKPPMYQNTPTRITTEKKVASVKA